MINRYVKLNMEPNSPEWYKYREGKIGMSNIAAIMGKDPWVSPLMLWEEMVMGKKRASNAAMQRGHDEEPKARAWINEQTGAHYEPVVLQSTIHPWLMCSLDGLDLNADPAIIEIKTPSKASLINAASGMVSPGYILQMQGQMWITGLEKVMFLAWDGEKGIRLSIQRCEKTILEIESAVIAFRRNIIDLIPPDPTNRDEHAILDPVACNKAERLRQIDQTLSQLQTERESICEDLKAACGDHSINLVNGYRISQFPRKGSIDYAQMLIDHPIPNIEKYRKKSTTSWRFSCKQ